MKVPRLRLIAGRYFWRPTKATKALGFTNEALGDDLPKAIQRARALNQQVADALAGIVRAAAVEEGSLAALIRSYQAAEPYKALRATTRRQYDSTLRQIEAAFGKVQVAGVEPEDIDAAFKRARDVRGHAAAVNDVRLYRILFDHAIATKLRKDNPAKAVTISHPEHRSRVWTPGEFEALYQTAVNSNRASIALASLIAYEIGQRVSDVLALTWAAYHDGVFHIRQVKTGRRVAVPAPPRLKRALTDIKVRHISHIVACETTGEPYKKDWFKHEFARIRKLAGLENEKDPADTPTFHDLRRTAMTEWGDAGGTDDEIRSGGGISRDTASIYVQPTSTMAGNAVAKREVMRKKRAKGR